MASATTLKEQPVPAPALRVMPAMSWQQRAARRFMRNRVSVIAAIALLCIVLAAVFAPAIAPHDPAQQFRGEGRDKNGIPIGPTAKFPLGVDGLQRDMLSRLIFGARATLLVGVLSSFLAVMLGVTWGSIAALAGGRIDNLMMRAVDVMMSLPGLFVILLIIVVLQQRSLWVTIFVIVITSWTYPARVFRAEILSLRERDYITASRSLGARSLHIFTNHLLPQLLPLIVIYVSLGVPSAIFTEAGLSFLGLGVPPPTPVWGGMIQEGRNYYRASPMLVVLPGLAIMFTVVCFTLVGNGLRDALDPTVE